MIRIVTSKEHLKREDELFARIKKDLEVIVKNKEDKNIMLLVPDQFMLSAEKLAISKMQIKSFFNFEVSSFKKLARKLNLVYGEPELPYINKTSKNMILAKIMINEKKDFLGKNKITSINKISNQIEELKAADIDAGTFTEEIQNLKGNDFLYQKLSFFSNLYSEYEKKISGKFYDKNDLIKRTNENIREKNGYDFVPKTNFYIYGYEYLSRLQIETIRALSEKTDVNIYLLADENLSFFSSNNEIIKELKGAKKEALNFEDEEDTLSKIRKCFPENIKGEKIKRDDSFKILKMNNPYDEALYVAQKVREILDEKDDNGDLINRNDDIKILLTDSNSYQTEIENFFNLFDIPFYSDDVKDVSEKTLLIFISALIDLTVNIEDTAPFLKIVRTGYLTENIYEVLNLLRASEFNINDFQNARKLSKFASSSEGPFNEASKIAESLRDFVKKINSAEKINDKLEVLRSFVLENVGEENAGGENAGGENKDITAFEKLIEKSKNIFEDETLTKEDFAEIMVTGLSSLAVSEVPRTFNQVLIGTVKRTKIAKSKYIFILGANDEYLSFNESDKSFILDAEIKGLEKSKQLRSGESKRSEENINFYKIVSSALKECNILYSDFDKSGGQLHESFAITKFSKIMFGDDAPENASEDASQVAENIRVPEKDPSFIQNEKTARLFYAMNLSESSDDKKVKSYLKILSEKFDRKKISFEVSETNVNPLLLQSINNVIDISVSKVQKYIRCPYQHLISEVLKVKTIDKSSFALDIGNAFHKILEFIYKMKWGDKHFLEDEEKAYEYIKDVTNKVIDGDNLDYENKRDNEYKNRNKPIFLTGYEDFYKKRYTDIINSIVISDVRGYLRKDGEIKLSQLKTLGTEDKEDLKRTVNDISFHIHGRLDRWEEEESGKINIIDYKTSKVNYFKEENIKSGYEIQLPLYSFMIKEDKEVFASPYLFGIVDLPIEYKEVEKIAKESKESKESKDEFYKIALAKRYVLTLPKIGKEKGGKKKEDKGKDQAEVIENLKNILSISEKILNANLKNYSSGKFTAAPLDRCDYDPYHSYSTCELCKFNTLCGKDNENLISEFNNSEKLKPKIWRS